MNDVFQCFRQLNHSLSIGYRRNGKTFDVFHESPNVFTVAEADEHVQNGNQKYAHEQNRQYFNNRLIHKKIIPF
jgi:hypothetical protein